MAKLRKFTRKTNNVKLNNKKYSKEVKKGKIKPKSNWSYQAKKKRGKQGLSLGHTHAQSQKNEDSDVDVTDMLEKPDKNTSRELKRKRDEDGLPNLKLKKYEKRPRSLKNNDDSIRHLLPIKSKSGLIPQSIREDVKQETFHIQIPSLKTILPEIEATEIEPQPTTLVGKYVKRQKNLEELKEKVGLASSSIVENPEENIHRIKELLNYLESEDPDLYVTSRKITALSLVEVFKDIIPAYRIRPRSEAEQNQRLKKETRQLQEYEQALLKYYKQFLTCLENWIVTVKSKNLKKPSTKVETKIEMVLALLALKCYSELITSQPHFNYSSNIIKMLTDRLAHRSKEISEICCSAISQVFKNDRVGEISQEAMKNIRKLVKARDYNVPPEVLSTFLTLNVREAITDKDGKRQEIQKIRQKMLTMSRKEKQRAKKMAELENEMLEVQAEESRQKKSQLQTDILENVFIIYFNVLKNSKNKCLLTPVMEGLAKFAHFINLDFFNDLITLLYQLIQTENLSARQILHCLKTVFTILSGQGEALNIDPQGFYVYLYSALWEIYSVSLAPSDCELLLECIDAMLTQRKKKVTMQRVFAFTKRFASLALQIDARLALAFMAQIRSLMQQHPTVDALLDTENTGSGIYSEELNDPEYCNAQATCLFELRYLAEHYNPTMRKYSEHIMLKCPSQGQKGQLPLSLSVKSPKELYSIYGKHQESNV